MDGELEDLLFAGAVIVLWYLLSRYLGAVITDYYYLIETISLLLIFGLIYEVWTSIGADIDLLEVFIWIGEEFGRTGAQLSLLFGVSSLVFTSILFRNWVEMQFGPLAVVQLLAIIAVISRMFVNVHATGDPWEILDGDRVTYLIYGVGFFAIILSFVIRGSYYPTSTTHNAIVIFLSTFIPSVYLYAFAADKDLPSLKDLVKSIDK
ncbi:hypothetical protein [Halostella pelagica]|uniref:hypothetical protein n=1 Tax=Halostella pelagica TaxID=2583824 RepID=UPI001080C4C0|nr:hypothetical protein [Halostella pelagica]